MLCQYFPTAFLGNPLPRPAVGLWQSGRLTITEPTILTQKFAPSSHTVRQRRQPGVKFYPAKNVPSGSWWRCSEMADDPLLVSLEGAAVPDCLSEERKCPGAKKQRSVPIYRVWAAKGCSQEKPSHCWCDRQINMSNREWCLHLQAVLVKSTCCWVRK